MDKFVRLPTESVSLCAESLGIQLSQEVKKTLVEDVSFRIRQITDVACQWMRHCKRRRLTTADIDKALHWSSVEPVYGYDTSSKLLFQPIHESGLFSVKDEEVQLADVAFSTPVEPSSLVDPPSVSAVWLTLEGVSVVSKTGDPTVASDTVIELKVESTESQKRYLSLLLSAITGDGEDIRQVALHDLQSNPTIATVLPQICQFIQHRMNTWNQYTAVQLCRLIKLITTLFKNQHLFLDPYVQSILSLVQSVVLSPGYLHSSESTSHWHVRELSAIALAVILKKCGSSSINYMKDLHASFVYQLSQQEVSLPVLYGVILSLCYLGGKSIAEMLLPRMAHLSSYIQNLLDNSLPFGQQNTLRVYSVLLCAANVLLTSSHGRSTLLRSAFLSNESTLEFPLEWEGLTLYEFLVELFGERLILSLETSAHSQRLAQLSPTAPEPRIKPDSGILPLDRQQTLINASFRQHQAREGFVNTVSVLHQKWMVQCKLKPTSTQYAFFRPCSMRKYQTPVVVNVLEQSTRSKQQSSIKADIIKGKKASTRKRALARHCLSDVSSCWL